MKRQVEYLQKLFYDLWNDFGSVYVVVDHSDRTKIGRRGFTDEERERGLVLVFNDKTNTQLKWDSEGNLSCVLAFGTGKEDVHIHHDDLRGVFSPEAGVHFLRNDNGREQAAPEQAEASKPEASEGAAKQVVSLSLYRKKKKDAET